MLGRLGVDATAGTGGVGVDSAGFSGAGLGGGETRASAGSAFGAAGAGATEGPRAASTRFGGAGRVGSGRGGLGSGDAVAAGVGGSGALTRGAGPAGGADAACSGTAVGDDAAGVAGELAGISVEGIGPERRSQISTPALTSTTRATIPGQSRRPGAADVWCAVLRVGIFALGRSRSAFLSASRM